MANTDELRAVRARLRAWDGCKNTQERYAAYRGTYDTGLGTDDLAALNMAHQRDMRAIVAADLAGHPVGDAEPVTPDWHDRPAVPGRYVRWRRKGRGRWMVVWLGAGVIAAMKPAGVNRWYGPFPDPPPIPEAPPC